MGSINKIISWIFSPSTKPIYETDVDFYEEIAQLKKRVEILEHENIETTNTLYEIINSISMK
jgi:phospholipid N-methyltransferase